MIMHIFKKLLLKRINSPGYSLMSAASLNQLFAEKASMERDIKKLSIEREDHLKQRAAQEVLASFASVVQNKRINGDQKHRRDARNLVTHIDQPRADELPIWALLGPYVKQQN